MGAAADLPVTVRGLEVAVPPGMGPDEFFRVLGRVEPPVYVEIPATGAVRRSSPRPPRAATAPSSARAG